MGHSSVEEIQERDFVWCLKTNVVKTVYCFLWNLKGSSWGLDVVDSRLIRALIYGPAFKEILVGMRESHQFIVSYGTLKNRAWL